MAANGRSTTQSEIDRSAVLRRVAIVLNSLPPTTSEKLLGTFDQGAAASLKRAMRTLVDVDPMEQKRAMEAFRVSLRSPASSAQPNNLTGAGVANHDAAVFAASKARHDEAQHGAVRPITHASLESAAAAPQAGSSGLPPILKDQGNATSSSFQPANASALSFLGGVPVDDLKEMLAAEHPQAIALVLASIEPQVAAEVLPGLPEPLRSQAVNRIGRLGEIPNDAAVDLAGHFRAKLRQRRTQQTSTAGKRTLAAIMAAMPPSESARYQTTKGPPALERRETMGGSPIARAADFHATPTAQPAIKSEAQAIAESLTNRLSSIHDDELAGHAAEPGITNASSESDSEQKRFTNAADQIHSYQPPTVSPADPPVSDFAQEERFESTDDIHQYLQSLSPMDLCQSLGKVGTHDAMLTLCGLPSEVAEAALGVLPKEQANAVRIKMASLNSINLREIDQAKEKVAQVAQALQSGQQPAPVPMAA